MKGNLRKYKKFIFVWLIGSIFIGCSKNATNNNLFADTIYFDFQYENLLNWSGTNCQAIAVRSNKILFMGSRVGAEQYMGPNTKIILFNEKSPLNQIKTSDLNRNGQTVGFNSVELNLKGSVKK